MKTAIEMTREAGIDEWETGSDTARTASQTRRLNRLERFAALVREDEREKIFEELMAMHREANGQHNYYHVAANEIRG